MIPYGGIEFTLMKRYHCKALTVLMGIYELVDILIPCDSELSAQWQGNGGRCSRWEMLYLYIITITIVIIITIIILISSPTFGPSISITFTLLASRST